MDRARLGFSTEEDNSTPGTEVSSRPLSPELFDALFPM